MEQDAIVRIRSLNKTFTGRAGKVTALDGIDLDIRRGEIFGIIGLSGAGKSTLVRCMNLLERPTSGAVLVDGKDMMKLREKELPFGEFLDEARQFVALCRELGAVSIINDNVEIARLTGADGVHVGQEDMAAARAREILGWEPRVDIEGIIASAWEWHCTHPHGFGD